jgi:hypothetical protein
MTWSGFIHTIQGLPLLEITLIYDDIQGIEHLIDENKLKYSLDSLAKRYLRKSKYEVELRTSCTLAEFGKRAKVKESLWRLHANDVS